MPRAGFYNDNEYRHYPFVFKQPDGLPDDLVVDCGFIMGLDSGFDADQHFVYLQHVIKTDTTIELEFRTTAPAAADFPIVFRRTFSEEDWTTEFALSVGGTAYCATEAMWEGFIVTGVMSTTVALMTVNSIFQLAQGTPPVYSRVVEPGRVQSLVKSYLRSISLANYQRIIIPPCEDGNIGITPPSADVIVNSRCLAGDVRFKPGFNCGINQLNYSNVITITAQKGVNAVGVTGDPEICEYGSEIKLYDTEIPPIINTVTNERSKFLSGGPACDQVITSINGLTAPNVKIVGGAGIQILADTADENTIVLKVSDNLLTENC